MTSKRTSQELRNPELAADKSEVNLLSIALFGGLLVFACLVAMSILAGLFSFYYHREAGLDQPDQTQDVRRSRRVGIARRHGHNLHIGQPARWADERGDGGAADHGTYPAFEVFWGSW